MADGYLLERGAMTTVPPVTAILSISGRAPGGAVEALAGLLPVVETRLRELVLHH